MWIRILDKHWYNSFTIYDQQKWVLVEIQKNKEGFRKVRLPPGLAGSSLANQTQSFGTYCRFHVDYLDFDRTLILISCPFESEAGSGAEPNLRTYRSRSSYNFSNNRKITFTFVKMLFQGLKFSFQGIFNSVFIFSKKKSTLLYDFRHYIQAKKKLFDGLASILNLLAATCHKVLKLHMKCLLVHYFNLFNTV